MFIMVIKSPREHLLERLDVILLKKGKIQFKNVPNIY